MGLLDLVFGRRCDSCGRRGSDVSYWRDVRRNLCTKDRKVQQSADRSRPYGSRAAGYEPGRPPKIAGPMGQPYRGQQPPPQRRR